MQVERLHFIEDSGDEIFISRLLLENQSVDIEVKHHRDFAHFETYLKLSDADKKLVVLVDMNMPAMRGDTVIRQLLKRSDLKDAIIGMCSGSEDPADKKSAFDAGAAFFAQKPLDTACLQSICAQVPHLNLQADHQKKTILHRS